MADDLSCEKVHQTAAFFRNLGKDEKNYAGPRRMITDDPLFTLFEMRMKVSSTEHALDAADANFMLACWQHAKQNKWRAMASEYH